MSSPEAERIGRVGTALNTAAADLAERLAAAAERPETVDAAALQALLAATVRLYAAKVETGPRLRPFGEGGGGVTATDVMIAATAMLHAVNVQLFELGMWQAWTGAHALHPGEPAGAMRTEP